MSFKEKFSQELAKEVVEDEVIEKVEEMKTDDTIEPPKNVSVPFELIQKVAKKMKDGDKEAKKMADTFMGLMKGSMKLPGDTDDSLANPKSPKVKDSHAS